MKVRARHERGEESEARRATGEDWRAKGEEDNPVSEDNDPPLKPS